MFIQQECLCKATETGNFNHLRGGQGRREAFLYTYVFILLEFFLISMTCSQNSAVFSLGLTLGLRGCDSASVKPHHCLLNWRGINIWPHTAPE